MHSLYSRNRVGADFFYSVPPGTEDALSWGTPHYSWRVACELFVSMLQNNGLQGQMLANPHIYDHPISRRLLAPQTKRPLHLIFRPFEQIRALKPGYNIGCIVWEFDRLNGEKEGQHPFSNQVRMLSCLDETWTASTFSQTVFTNAGIKNVHRIPAPISSNISDPLTRKRRLELLSFAESVTLNVSHYRSHEQNIDISRRAIRPLSRQPALANIERKKIFVTVLNPGDDRKNIGAMLKGFSALHAQNPDALLLIKCTVDNVDTKLVNVQNDTIKPKIRNLSSIASAGVVLISSHLSGEEMAELYSLADFYLCTSRCEGQNLPLLEAMSYGAVPVSVNNTAMADYINDSNAFVIQSEAAPVLIHNATAHWQPDLHWYEADVRDVFLAAVQASQAGIVDIERKRVAAWRTVENLYSPKIIFGKLSERLNALVRSHAQGTM